MNYFHQLLTGFYCLLLGHQIISVVESNEPSNFKDLIFYSNANEYYSEGKLRLNAYYANIQSKFDLTIFGWSNYAHKPPVSKLSSTSVDDIINSHYYLVATSKWLIVQVSDTFLTIFDANNYSISNRVNKTHDSQYIFDQSGHVWLFDEKKLDSQLKPNHRIIYHCILTQMNISGCKGVDIPKLDVDRYELVYTFYYETRVYYILRIANSTNIRNVLVRLTKPESIDDLESIKKSFSSSYLIDGYLNPNLITFTSRVDVRLIFIYASNLYSYTLQAIDEAQEVAITNCANQNVNYDLMAFVSAETLANCYLGYNGASPKMQSWTNSLYKSIIQLDAFFLGANIQKINFIAFLWPQINGNYSYTFGHFNELTDIKGPPRILTLLPTVANFKYGTVNLFFGDYLIIFKVNNNEYISRNALHIDCAKFNTCFACEVYNWGCSFNGNQCVFRELPPKGPRINTCFKILTADYVNNLQITVTARDYQVSELFSFCMEKTCSQTIRGEVKSSDPTMVTFNMSKKTYERHQLIRIKYKRPIGEPLFALVNRTEIESQFSLWSSKWLLGAVILSMFAISLTVMALISAKYSHLLGESVIESNIESAETRRKFNRQSFSSSRSRSRKMLPSDITTSLPDSRYI